MMTDHQEIQNAQIPAATDNKSAPSNGTDRALEAWIDFGDRYEILQTIGQGDTGTVYRLKDKVLDKELAAKVLREDFATDPCAIKRLEQEADAASRLTHHNILTTYGRGSTASGAQYILMDLLEGESLAQVLKSETRLAASQVIDISTQICDGLAHAQKKGLIHRDLKPSNIMLTHCDGASVTVKVLDFGVAKLKATSNRETQNLTETEELFASPSYMSPEQCLGFSLDTRSDIYSLGCMMYEMLSGQPPFSGKTPIQTVIQHLNDKPPSLAKLLSLDQANQTTKRLQAIIMRCLEKSPAQRYQSMDDLKVDLQLLATHATVGSEVTSFRNLFFTLSRIAPMLMPTIIVGLAIIVSYMAMMLNIDKNQIEADKNQIKALRASNDAKSRVVFTLKDIPEGNLISKSDLEEREIRTSKVPEDAITSSELLIGRKAKYGIAAGEIVSQHCIAANGRLEQPLLQEGMRAISFGVDTNAGVAGFVEPGSRVDILAIVGSGVDIKALPILSDVEVLRVGQNPEKQVGPNGPRSFDSVTLFTVALAPTEAARLAKAVAVGKLYLTIRNDRDHTPIATVDINRQLLEGEPGRRLRPH